MRIWSFIALLAILNFASTAWAQKARHAEVTQAALNFSALRAGQDAVLAVELNIRPGYHAQSHTPLDPGFREFEVSVDPNPALEIGQPQYPQGRVEQYPAGKFSVYTGDVIVRIPIKVIPTAAPGTTHITGKLNYQICDDNQCYLPEQSTFSIDTQIVPADASVQRNTAPLFELSSAPSRSTQPSRGSDASAPVAPPLRIAGQTLTPEAKLLAFLTAFLVGILFNVMPCVLPVLPLKAIGFYEASHHSRARSLSFGAVFSAGLVGTFATFGILIFAFHAFDWGQLFTKWWFTLFIVVVLLAMGASTFGAFTVTLPPALYNVSPRHDTYFGNFLFGILTALLSTPCTFGMFVGLLAWAITQPTIIGIMMLVTVGIGMACPYLVLSAFPEVARRFPRTGPWAELVKQMMGFLLVVSAVYFARPFIGRVVHGENFWWVPFGVIIIAALFLVVRSSTLSNRPMPRLIGTSLGLLLAIGALLAVLRLTSKPYQWQPYSDAALQEARGAKRIVLIDFTADWCGTCQYVEATVLHSNPVVSIVRRHDVLMLKADVTRDDAPARPLLDKLNPAGSIPLTVIYSPNLTQPIELTGIYSRDDLQRAIELAAQPAPTAVAQR